MMNDNEKNQPDKPLAAEPRKKKLPWSCLVIMLLPSVSFFVFPAYSLYYKNAGEFSFGVSAVTTYALLGCGGLFLLLSIVMLLLARRKAFYAFCAVAFSLGLGCYVQYNFLNPAFASLDGSPIDWSAFATQGILSAVFWLVCLAASIFLAYRFKDKCLLFLKGIALFVVGIEVATVVTLVVTTPPHQLSSFSVTKADLLDVSDENIVVFVLDTVDESLFQELRQTAPELSNAKLENFVSFTNCISGGSPTIFGLPLLLTGQPYDPADYEQMPGHYDDYLKASFNKCDLYRDLAGNGYRIGLYTEAMYLQGCPEDLVENLGYGSWMVGDKVGFARTLYKFCAFLTAPQQLKPAFWCYTEEFSKLVTLKDYEGGVYTCSSANDYEVYQQIAGEGLSYTPGEKNFRFYHLMGCHDPYDLDENMNFSNTSSLEQKTRGEFMTVMTYIDQLKALGVYDNTTVVITADHGNRHEQAYAHPMVLVKPRNYHAAFSQVDTPVQFMQFPATLASQFMSDYSAYGESYFDVTEGEYPDRYLMVHEPLLDHCDEIPKVYDQTSNVVKFLFHGNVDDNNYEIAGSYK